MTGKSFLLLLLLTVLQPALVRAQASDPPFLTREASAWADSVLKGLSYEQKIGQLFMIDAYSNKDSAHVAQIEALIRDYHIGGVIFFQGSPYRQAVMTNRFQSLSPVPLMIGIDGEWGLSMRLDSTIRFPRQMTLSAAGKDSLIYQVGREIGKQCRRMGIHINFAPVADVNNNPANPVINTRSFGDDPDDVAARAGSFLKGMQSEHVMGCLKHFPGHGDTDADSHLALPLISKSKEQLLETELKPFRELLKEQPVSVMVGHLYVPALDSTEGLASSLSPKVVTDLLEHDMGYRGLVFTDALNMKGVADFYPPGEIALKALLAGNDILLFSADVPSAFWRIHYALQNCEIEQEAIDFKVKKILMAKYWAGLHQYSPIDLNNLTRDLNNPEAGSLAFETYASAVTLLKNDSAYLPLKDVRPGRIASLVIGDSLNNRFQTTLGTYAQVDRFMLPRDFSSAAASEMLSKLSASGYETVILSIHNILTKASSRYGITDTTADFIDSLSRNVNLVSVVFGNSYGLLRLRPVLNSRSLLIAYEDTWNPHMAAAQVIMGGMTAGGVIPVTVNDDFKKGAGLCNSGKPERLGFTWPEVAGIPSDAFDAVDSMTARVVNSGSAPGGQVLVAWNGKIILQKPFGSFTGDSSRMVRNGDLYDIASVTKIAATALAVMKLADQKKLDVTKKASYYLPELKHSNKKNLILADILTHQAGLQAWIPFWKETMENGKPSYNVYHPEKDVNYSRMVADSLFILPSYSEKIWKTVVDSKVEKPGKYVYSDLGLLIMQRIVEKITDMPMDTYLEKEFYEPLGLYRLCFNPLEKYPASDIAPTEWDTAFRKRLVRGTVHDPASAMLGGVAGNAGLFSDAGSLAVIMQMLLNHGEYGGKRYLSAEVVKKFTSRYYVKGDNRRGLLFDKPEPAAGKEGPTARSASPATFGHTGFTGTCAWADPDEGLVYIFLSNRVYPDAANNKLAKGNFRTDIMEEIYRVLKQYGR